MRKKKCKSYSYILAFISDAKSCITIFISVYTVFTFVYVIFVSLFQFFHFFFINFPINKMFICCSILPNEWMHWNWKNTIFFSASVEKLSVWVFEHTNAVILETCKIISPIDLWGRKKRKRNSNRKTHEIWYPVNIIFWHFRKIKTRKLSPHTVFSLNSIHNRIYSYS